MVDKSDENDYSSRKSTTRTINCCGTAQSDKPGRLGTYLSYVLIISCVVASLITQKYAQYIPVGSWSDGCRGEFENICKSNSACFRFSFALVIFFTFQGFGSFISAYFYDNFWGIKIICFVALVIGFFFASSNVFNDNGYAWFARFAGFAFLILQQVILLDLAFVWNERWVAFSEERDEANGSFYLYGLLFFSFILFGGSIASWVIMYWQFTCTKALIIISLTVGLSTLATLYQVFGTEHGSLLTSAILTAYVTYICFSSITLNPDASCNPTIGDTSQGLSQAIGMVITVISLSWTTASTVSQVKENAKQSFSAAVIAPDPVPTNENVTVVRSKAHSDIELYDTHERRTLFIQVSMVFLLISAYFAMVLTNWATEQKSEGSQVASQRSGDVAMWLQASAEWIALLMYIWSLVAPALFPDRDFGH